MFPSFNKEESNYLACWKNVFKGKVNLEGGESIYEKITQMPSTQPVNVSSPEVLTWSIAFIYEQGEYFPVMRLILPSQKQREDCTFLPPWLESAGYIQGWSTGDACGYAARVWIVH